MRKSGMRRAFTIIELMLVIAIIAVLSTLIITGASHSLRATRTTRAKSLFAAVELSMNTYKAQYGKWPGSFGSRAAGGGVTGNDPEDPSVYTLNASEVRSAVKALVDEVRNGNPIIDVTALFVSREPGEKQPVAGASGLDFMTAIRGSRKNAKKMKTAEMYFGYPISSNGHLRRFGMCYSIPTDKMTVGYIFLPDTKASE